MFVWRNPREPKISFTQITQILFLGAVFLILLHLLGGGIIGAIKFFRPGRAKAASGVAVTGQASVLNSNGYLNFTSNNANVTLSNTTRQFSGYAWSDDLGWVAFGTQDNSAGPVSYNASGAVSGKAKVLADSTYLDFNSSPYGSNVTINSSGAFSGYAWLESLGWLNFSGVSGSGISFVDHYTITASSSTQTPGDSFTVTIYAKNSTGSTDTGTSGDKSLTFSGPSSSSIGDYSPKAKDKNGSWQNFGTSTTINFSSGTANASVILYKSQSTSIDVTDGTYSSTGDSSYDLDITVLKPTGTIEIEDGDIYTDSSVTLKFTSSRASYLKVSNSSDFSDVSWEDIPETKSWTLPSPDGQKYVYAKFKDSYGNESNTESDSIYLDSTAPSISLYPPSKYYNSQLNLYYLDSLRPRFRGKVYDNIQPSKVEVTLSKANRFLGIITSYTVLEITTLSLTPLSSTIGSFSYIPRQSLQYGSRYHLSFKPIDEALNQGSPATLDIEIKTPSALKQLELKKKIQLIIPQLEEKQALRMEKQAEELKKLAWIGQEFKRMLAFIGKPFKQLLIVINKGVNSTLNSLQKQLTQSLASLGKTNQKLTELLKRQRQKVTVTLKNINSTLTTFQKPLATTLPSLAQAGQGVRDLLSQQQQKLVAFVARPFKQLALVINQTLRSLASQFAQSIQKTARDGSKLFSLLNRYLSASQKLVLVGAGQIPKEPIKQNLLPVKEPLQQTKITLLGFGHRLKVATLTWYSLMADPRPTQISDTRVEKVASNEAVVSWKTNHYTTNNKVNFGKTLSYGNSVSSLERAKSHQFTLTNLQPKETYYFEVMSQNKNYVYDSHYSFTTPPEGEEAKIITRVTIKGAETQLINIYEQPSSQSKVIDTVQSGQSFPVEDFSYREKGWVKIEKGWVSLESVNVE